MVEDKAAAASGDKPDEEKIEEEEEGPPSSKGEEGSEQPPSEDRLEDPQPKKCPDDEESSGLISSRIPDNDDPTTTMVQAESPGKEEPRLYSAADPYTFPEEDVCARQFNNNNSSGFNYPPPPPHNNSGSGNNSGPYSGHPPFHPSPTFVQGPYGPGHMQAKGSSCDVFIDEEHEDAGELLSDEGKDWDEFASFGEDNGNSNEDEDRRLVIAEEEFKKEDEEGGEECGGGHKEDEESPKSPAKTNNANSSSKRPLNGISDEELSKKLLPDLLRPDLDLLIIGVNPGIYAAVKGHHYFGPANHFWKCMLLSGLLPQAMSAEEDYKLLELGIGFTNVVQRSSRRTSQLTRKEIEDGIHSLNEKIRKYSPKIAVFNGKGIYEVFSGKKEFYFGKQPEKIPGTETYVWVLPNSSSRCAQLPSAVDKVPFYAALKKFRDLIKGLLTEEVCEEDFIFKELKIRGSSYRSPPNGHHSVPLSGPVHPQASPHLPPQMPPQQQVMGHVPPPHPPHPHSLSPFMNYHPVHPLHFPPPPPHPAAAAGPPFHPMKPRVGDEFEDHYEYGPPYPGGPNNMESYYQYYDVDPVTGKKRRGRPPKPRTDGTMPPPKRKTLDPEGNPIRRGSNPIDPLTGKKKRGRPKKIEGEEGSSAPKAHKKTSKKQQQQQLVVQEDKNGVSGGGVHCPPLEHVPTFPPHHIPSQQQQQPIQPLPPFSPNFGRSLGGEMGLPPPKEDLDKQQKEDMSQHHLQHHQPSYMDHQPYTSEEAYQYSSPPNNSYPPYGGYPPPYEQQQPPSSNTGKQEVGSSSNSGSSPEDVSSKSITGLESLVDQIPALESESGVFSAGSHPATPRSVGPYSPAPTPGNNGSGYAYGSPGNYAPGGVGEYHHPESSPSSYSNTPSGGGANGGSSERASPSTNSSNFSVSSLMHTPPSSSEPPPPEAFSVSNLTSSSSSSNSSCSSSSSTSSGYHTEPPPLKEPGNKYYPSNSPSGAGTASYGMYGFGSSYPPPHPHPSYYGQYHAPAAYASSGGFNAPYPPPANSSPSGGANYPPYGYGQPPPAAAAAAYPPQTPYF